MTSRKFKLQNYYPPEIFLSWCIRAVGNFYSIKCSLRKKTRLPLDAERLSCLYIQRCACMDVICKESCIWKICALAPKFLVFFWLTLSKKIDSPRKQYTSFDVKMLLLTGKIGKAFGVWDLNCVFMINKIPAIIFKLGGWHTAKTGACFCFSSVFVRQKPGCLSRLTSLGEFWVLVKLA